MSAAVGDRIVAFARVVSAVGGDAADLLVLRDLTEKIGQNGRISYPFLGELAVAGKTLGALQNSLVEGLKPDYLLDPRISVSIVKYRPFFVNGEVRNPGGLPFQPGLTLRKAISLAGGFTERANTKEMMVIADNDPDHTERTVGLDYQVRPGDIITVKDTFF